MIGSKIGQSEQDAKDGKRPLDGTGKAGKGTQKHEDKAIDIEEMLSAFDKAIQDAELARKAKTPYEEILRKYGKYIDEMVVELENFFMKDEMPQLSPDHFKSGSHMDLKKDIQSQLKKRITGSATPTSCSGASSRRIAASSSSSASTSPEA